MVSKVVRATVLGAAASAMAVTALILKKRKFSTPRPREPKVDQEIARERYINSILCRGEQHCIDQIRMKPLVFSKLCEILEENNLLRTTRNMSIREQVLVFLHLIGHNVRFRVIGGRFYRSIETVHRYFKIVLRAILKLFNLVVKQPDDLTPPEIRNNNRFYPYFKDCIGAIDGSLIRAKVSEELAGRFRGRKGGTTQNILASITFDLKFTYVLAGWEGSAHDSSIIRNALERPGGLVIPEGKYYLGDAGYGVRNGIFCPTHPNHEKYLNKKIEMYNEMSLVVGKDMATGAFAKSFSDIDLEASIGNSSAQDIEDNEFEEVTKPKEVLSSGPSSKSRSHRKRSREDGDSSYELIAGKLGEMANAIKLGDDKTQFTENLYKEVMKTEGFEEEFLGSVFDHLNANNNLAQGFMVKNESLRRKWIEKFMTQG